MLGGGALEHAAAMVHRWWLRVRLRRALGGAPAACGAGLERQQRDGGVRGKVMGVSVARFEGPGGCHGEAGGGGLYVRACDFASAYWQRLKMTTMPLVGWASNVVGLLQVQVSWARLVPSFPHFCFCFLIFHFCFDLIRRPNHFSSF